MSSRPELRGSAIRLAPGVLAVLLCTVGLHIHAGDEGDAAPADNPEPAEVEAAVDDPPAPDPASVPPPGPASAA